MLLALCLEQRRLGVDASVLSARLPEESERAIDAYLRKLDVPVISWPMNAGLNLRAMREIRAWSLTHGVSVLHSHGYKFNVLLALTPRAASIRTVTTVHGYTSAGVFNRMTLYKQADKLSHLALDRIVYVSPALRGPWRFNAAKRLSIPNGIDVSRLPTVAERKCEGRADGAGVRLLAVGRLAPEKNFELLFCALAVLKERGLSVSLDVFGEGPEEARLRHIIEDGGLNEIHLRGYSDHIAAELSQHDILVVSSITEGMPMTVIEAMCMGMRIVATSVGGIPTLLANYPMGILVRNRDAIDLADAIQLQIANSRFLEEREISNIRERMSSATMARRYTRLYEEMLAGV